MGLLSDRTREARDRQVTQRPPGPSERGSPPRTWGIRRSWPRSGTSSTVHPHARGEYGSNEASGPNIRGSPPRTWGIRATTGGSVFWGGGSPPRTWGIQVSATDQPGHPRLVHPHARGEYVIRVSSLALAGVGSPPRTWGILASGPACRPSVQPRFTPTHVGNTPMNADSLVDVVLGSPPRTWGIPVASAGHSSYRPSVHPHARGEYVQTVTSRHRRGPVHPHARGDDRSRPSRAGGGRRFTPTHVGTTVRTSRSTCRAGGSPPRTWGPPSGVGHGRPLYGSPPRTWGPCVASPNAQVWLSGSPPRTWGNLAHIDAKSHRFTPTHVGTLSVAKENARVALHRFTPTHVGN